MGLVAFTKDKMIGGALKKLADSEPRTTISGWVLAGIVGANVDYDKVLNGDRTEQSKLVGAAVLAVFSYFVNHKKLVGQPTAAPVVAGGVNAQAEQKP